MKQYDIIKCLQRHYSKNDKEITILEKKVGSTYMTRMKKYDAKAAKPVDGHVLIIALDKVGLDKIKKTLLK